MGFLKLPNNANKAENEQSIVLTLLNNLSSAAKYWKADSKWVDSSAVLSLLNAFPSVVKQHKADCKWEDQTIVIT